MKSKRVNLVMLGLLHLVTLCWAPSTLHAGVLDWLLGKPVNQPPSVKHFAEEISDLEDEIRKYGSITAKHPDVWGQSNLMRYIQEYEEIMKNPDDFTETVQAYIARSDRAELQSTTELGFGLGGENPPGAEAKPADIDPVGLFNLIDQSVNNAGPAADAGVGVEPTERQRQESTYIRLNQALRRRNMGDDNSRQAGYALYLFRVPVSVLPGRKTHEGYAARITMQAQLELGSNHLRYTFPKLAISDLVDTIVPVMLRDWGADIPKPQTDRAAVPQDISPQRRLVPAFRPGSQQSVRRYYGERKLGEVRQLIQCHLTGNKEPDASTKPQPDDLREALFKYFLEVHKNMEANQLYTLLRLKILQAGQFAIRGNTDQLNEIRSGWTTKVNNNITPLSQASVKGNNKPNRQDCHSKTHGVEWAAASWLLALQSAILDQNIKELVTARLDMPAVAQEVAFFDPQDPTAVHIWHELIRKEFPIYAFTLDPQVEEQNVYDAFSRRRELQVALAFAVANGEINAEQAINFSRQLALDMTTIDLNRTIVGFAHSNDTFGWYYYPRVQTPPEESSNIEAFFRMLWQTGPTRKYDLRHRQLEPGIRNCEVLIAMPGFVPGVKFQITTNWERLDKPGEVLRDYDDILELGARMQNIRELGVQLCDQANYRADDVAVLFDRIDQLENLLPLQSYTVSLPYEYDLGGYELFDTGNLHLQPRLTGYYGLDYVSTEQWAEVFLTGRNFHPTHTQIIVGGGEVAQADILSRDLLKVRVKNIKRDLTRDPVEVRVSTPAGLSDPVKIRVTPPPEPPAAELTRSSLLISYKWRYRDDQQKYELVKTTAAPPLSLKWNVDGPKPRTLHALFRFSRQLKVSSNLQLIDDASREYRIPVNRLAHMVLDHLNRKRTYNPNHPPDEIVLTTDNISVKADHEKPTQSANQLTITFKQDPELGTKIKSADDSNSPAPQFPVQKRQSGQSTTNGDP